MAAPRQLACGPFFFYASCSPSFSLVTAARHAASRTFSHDTIRTFPYRTRRAHQARAGRSEYRNRRARRRAGPAQRPDAGKSPPRPCAGASGGVHRACGRDRHRQIRLVGRKLAATFSSTGTPAFFLHPVEGAHGDLGSLRKDDVIIAISNSGETAELNAILPALKSLGTSLIAMTGREDSTLGRLADVTLHSGVPVKPARTGLPPQPRPLRSSPSAMRWPFV